MSDMSSKPLFISGERWPELATKLGINQVLRIDAKGHLQVSKTLFKRLEFVGGKPQEIEIIP